MIIHYILFLLISSTNFKPKAWIWWTLSPDTIQRTRNPGLTGSRKPNENPELTVTKRHDGNPGFFYTRSTDQNPGLIGTRSSDENPE